MDQVTAKDVRGQPTVDFKSEVSDMSETRTRLVLEL